MTPISKLFDQRGVVAKHLAVQLGVSRPLISQWRTGTPIPADRVPAVEAYTGIPRYLLRPDLWKPGENNLSVEEAMKEAAAATRRFQKLRIRLKSLAAEADALAKELSL